MCVLTDWDVFILTFDRKAEDGSCYFGGWARMAHPLVAFSVVEVNLFCFIVVMY